MSFLNKALLTVIFVFSAIPASAEEILLFQSAIQPSQDGSMVVTENITYDFGTLFKHGIFRNIPLTHPQEASEWYKTRHTDIDIAVVLMDSEEVPHEISYEGDKVAVKIGDPDTEITGVHTYTISYKVDGAFSYTDESTELYWNVTGHDWEVPISQAQAIIDTSSGILTSQRFCYAGELGAADSCRGVYATSTHITFISPALGPGSGLTIAQELNRGVDKVILEDSATWIFWLFGSLVWLVLVGYWVYRYKTKFDPHAAVYAQYEPYADFKPMFTGVLIDGKLDPRDITAGLVYLAEQGFIKIRKTERKVMLFFEVADYEVILRKSVEEAESHFLKDVLYLLFSSSDAVGESMTLSSLKADTKKLRANQKTIQKLKGAVLEDLIERGYFEQLLPLLGWGVLGLVTIVTFSFVTPILSAMFGTFTFPVVLIALASIFIMAFAYQRRTVKGYEARNHLKGFKEFLSVTDKERFKFHNAPAKSPEQFMRLLPYAIALGVDEEWSKVFSDIQLRDPEWFEGGSGTFAPVVFTKELGAFSNAFTNSSSPSGSASSGGGSAGGGGGGGGGGSW